MTTNKYYTLILDKNNIPHITKRIFILEDIMARLEDLTDQIKELQDSLHHSSLYSLEVTLDTLNEKKDYYPIMDDNPRVQF